MCDPDTGATGTEPPTGPASQGCGPAGLVRPADLESRRYLPLSGIGGKVEPRAGLLSPGLHGKGRPESSVTGTQRGPRRDLFLALACP